MIPHHDSVDQYCPTAAWGLSKSNGPLDQAACVVTSSIEGTYPGTGPQASSRHPVLREI